MLQGGDFDGQLFSLLGPQVKNELRVATSEDVTPHDASVEVYALIAAEPLLKGFGQQVAASYRWTGSRKSATALVDFFVDAE